MTSARPEEPGLADAVRAGAAGLYSLEAACDLIIGAGWLHRDDFARFVTTAAPVTGGATELAHIDWQSAISQPRCRAPSLQQRGEPDPAAGSQHRRRDPRRPQRRPLRTRPASISLVVLAVRHANGQRPADLA